MHVQAESVLVSALKEGVLAVDERWAAVQCLVCAGLHSAAIISELFHHLWDMYHPEKQERAEQLLTSISHKTVSHIIIVGAMIMVLPCNYYCAGFGVHHASRQSE